jgi:GWxTD domain-containing protein
MALLVAAGLLAAGAAGPSRKERLAALPDEDRVWLTEYVAPIILPEEEKLFLELTEPHERERFKREFWQRRERDGLQPPLGPGYEGRYRELRPRADEVYDGWKSDAGQMVLRWGEPADIRPVLDCQYIFRDLEIWTYSGGPMGGSTTELGFYRPLPMAPRRLWNRQTGASEIFLPTSCRQTFASLYADCPESPVNVKLADKCKGPVCLDACRVFHLYQRILGASGALQERSSLFAPAPVPLEGLDRLKSMSATAADPKARPLHVEGPSLRPTLEPTPTPEPRHQLSVDEMRDRIVHLEPKYRQWLELAAPLLTLDELSLFLQLSPSEKDKFIRTFWKRQS